MDKTKIPQSAEVNTFKENILKTAEKLVADKFPQRIVHLNNLLTSSKLTSRPSSVYQKINIPVPEPNQPHQQQQHAKQESSGQEVQGTDNKIQTSNGQSGPNPAKRSCPTHEDTVTIGTRVLILPDGVVHSNHKIVELIDEIKPLIGELVEDTNLLKMWLVYLIPRIEDGNNFGVSIQEDVLAEIRASEGEAATYYDQISRYYAVRGKTVAKVAQYPHIEDYRRCIQELDEKEFFSLRLIVAELRNHYATLHDLISKNCDKIRKPRSSNAEHMF